MRKITNSFICLLLLLGITGCSNSMSSIDSSTVNLTRVSKFAKEKYIEYMNTLDIQSYDITETSLSARTGNDKHYIYVVKSDIIKIEANQKEKFIYGFDIIDNGNGDFEVFYQGTEVDSTYLTK